MQACANSSGPSSLSRCSLKRSPDVARPSRLGERSLAHGAPAPRRYGRSMWSLRPRTLPTGFVPPCLPTAVPSAPSGDQWWHEIKWDGIRVIARRKRENYPAVFKIASKSARLKSQGFELRWGPRKDRNGKSRDFGGGSEGGWASMTVQGGRAERRECVLSCYQTIFSPFLAKSLPVFRLVHFRPLFRKRGPVGKPNAMAFDCPCIFTRINHLVRGGVRSHGCCDLQVNCDTDLAIAVRSDLTLARVCRP